MLTGPLGLIGDFGLAAMPPGIPDRLRKAAVFLHSLDLQRLERPSLGFRQPIVEPTCAGNRLLQLATRSCPGVGP
jgi:hypothetical protein